MLNISKRDALVIVDVQNDFLPDGALAVPNGDRVIAPINALSALPFGLVVATQDWHTPDHVSFAAQGGPWPAHCVAGTAGADLAPGLHTAPIAALIRKGRLQARDSYSGFVDNDRVSETGLSGLLRGLQIGRVVVCGLAYDYCVAATAIDATRFGFESVVIEEGCAGIAKDPGPTRADLAASGVTILADCPE